MVISKGIEELDRGVVCLFLRDLIPDICLLVLNLLCWFEYRFVFTTVGLVHIYYDVDDDAADIPQFSWVFEKRDGNCLSLIDFWSFCNTVQYIDQQQFIYAFFQIKSCLFRVESSPMKNKLKIIRIVVCAYLSSFFSKHIHDHAVCTYIPFVTRRQLADGGWGEEQRCFSKVEAKVEVEIIRLCEVIRQLMLIL